MQLINVYLAMLLAAAPVAAQYTELAPFLGVGTSFVSVPFETQIGAPEWQTGERSFTGGVTFSTGIDHTFGRLGVHLDFGPRATFFPEEGMMMGVLVTGCVDALFRPTHHLLIGPSFCVETHEPLWYGGEAQRTIYGMGGVGLVVPFLLGDETELAPHVFLGIAPVSGEDSMRLVPSVLLGIDLEVLFSPAFHP